MTASEIPLPDATGTDLRTDAIPGPHLPLVSVIIVNYNYGRFLGEAIESVFAQTYPRIECLVVDNASTDCSAEVIAEALRRHPSLRLLQRQVNDGQTIAILEGLAETRGPYVIFLDADDYLLPRCVETHVQVHLTTRVHVGFTSADMLQVVNGEVVLGTNEAMATYLLGEPKERTGLLRPSRVALGTIWDGYDADMPKRVHEISPTQKRWVWSPTSGNCFRRDALDLFADTPNLGALRSQTDLFLALGINAVCGSILIDEPVFAYRLHGANVFSARPQLAGFLSFDPKRTGQSAGLARRLIVDQLTSHPERFIQEHWQSHVWLRVMRRMQTPREDGTGSHVATATLRDYPKLAAAMGKWTALLSMALLGVSWRRTLRLAFARNPSG